MEDIKLEEAPSHIYPDVFGRERKEEKKKPFISRVLNRTAPGEGGKKRSIFHL